MEELVAAETAVRLPCEHTFHHECVSKWLSKQHTCPTCRAPLPTRAAEQRGGDTADDEPRRTWADFPAPRSGGAPTAPSMYT